MELPYYFQREFLSQMMSRYADQFIEVLDVNPFSLDNSASILAVLTAGNTDRPIGHFGLNITYVMDAKQHTIDTVLKVKPDGAEVSAMLNGLAAIPQTALAKIYSEYQDETGFRNVHRCELDIHEDVKPHCSQKVFGVHADEDKGLFLILMESLLDTELLNTVMEPGQWTDEHIRLTIQSLAQWHVVGSTPNKPGSKPIHEYSTNEGNGSYMERLTPLWTALLTQASTQFPELYTPDRSSMMRSFISDIPKGNSEFESLPMTLIHNDCNPRNMCFKDVKGERQLCLYDWELATVHTPVYDVIEFLTFVLDEDRYHLWSTYLNYYFQTLDTLGNPYTKSQFGRAVHFAARDFGLHRLGMYMMAHAVAPYPFLPRVVNSYFHLLSLDHNRLLNSTYLED